ncbi:MAG: endonuclease [Xanthomonadales bacterium]|nr:endonuclease [Xanthomonadales bacterium]
MSSIKPAFLVAAFALAGFAPAALAQFVSLAPGTPALEDFDTLAASGTGVVLPDGWYFIEEDGNADGQYRAGDGSANNGDTWSFGVAGSSERALGGIASNSLRSTFGARLRNDSAESLGALTVAYTGEQWRVGGSGNADRLEFEYSRDATSLDSGTWIAVPELDFGSIVTSGAGRALDGNAPANRRAVAASLAGLDLAPGASLWLRWRDINIAGADDGLAIDEVVFTAGGGGNPGAAPAVASTSPAHGAVNVPAASDIRVSFTQPVTTSGAFSLACAGAAIALDESGSGTSRTLTPQELLPAAAQCRFDITAAAVRNGDGVPMEADVAVIFTVAAGSGVGDYYSRVNTSSPGQLRCSLHETIRGHTVYPYSGSGTNTWTILELAQQDPSNANRIIDVYRNRSYARGSDRAGTGSGLTYNREHTWPNSLGFASSGLAAYTDTHMLWLSDTDHNARRGNKPYGNCASGCSELATEANQGVGGPGQSNWYRNPDGSAGSFETWQHRKGEMARAIFYMAIRYEGIAAEAAHDGIIPDLELTDERSRIVTTSNTAARAYMGLLSDLLAWHAADPPDAEELARNDLIQVFQGNRNPFVDHPEWGTRALFESTQPTVCELAGGGDDDGIFADGFDG